ncbi:MAG: hypothetical protein MUE53_01635 [Chitinophagales bacterium]|jgi:hypothetical protein|nr:hypothetical protein [Chitinophagales bacterium]
MKKIIIFSSIFIAFLSLEAQNILKKELQGNTTEPHIPASSFKFKNTQPILFIKPVEDLRSMNWNKKVNDTVKIELIQDFWNVSYKQIVQNKIYDDLDRAGVELNPSKYGSDFFLVTEVMAHYPQYVVSNRLKGYNVYNNVLFKIESPEKGKVFEKNYEQIYLFDEKSPNWKPAYITDYKQGANIAMWICFQNLLDKFYFDLNEFFMGNTLMNKVDDKELKQKESNLTKDKSINENVTSLSGVVNDVKVPIQNVPTRLENDIKLPGNPIDTSINRITTPKIKDSLIKASIKSNEFEQNISKTVDEIKVNESSKKNDLEDNVKKPTKQELLLQKNKERIDSIIKAKNSQVDRKKQIEENRKRIMDSIAKSRKEPKATISKPKQSANVSSEIDEARIEALQNQEGLIVDRRKRDNFENARLLEKIRNAKEVVVEKSSNSSQKPNAKPLQEKLTKVTDQIDPIDSEQNKISKDSREEKIKKVLEEKLRKARLRDSISDFNTASDTFKKLPKTLANLEKPKSKTTNTTLQVKGKLNNDPTNLDSGIAQEVAIKTPKIKATKSTLKTPVFDSSKIEVKLDDPAKKIEELQTKALKKENKTIEDFKSTNKPLDLNKPQITLANTSLKKAAMPPSKIEDKRTPEEKAKDRVFEPKNEKVKELLSRVSLIKPSDTVNKSMNYLDSLFIAKQKQAKKDRELALKNTKSDTMTKSNIVPKILTDTIKDVNSNLKKKPVLDSSTINNASGKEIKPVDIVNSSKEKLEKVVNKNSKNIVESSKTKANESSEALKVNSPALDAATKPVQATQVNPDNAIGTKEDKTPNPVEFTKDEIQALKEKMRKDLEAKRNAAKSGN